MLVLTWNLKHGRSVPPSHRQLFDEFAQALAQWPWDIALLQEVPPWWPPALAVFLEAQERHVLTSRNSLLPLRRWLATRWPEAIKSNGGGSNAILLRGDEPIHEHRSVRLSWLPERRWVHGVRLHDCWVANLHTQAAPHQVELATTVAASWSGRLPLVIGGDFNLRTPALPGLEHAGGHEVDHVFVRGNAPSKRETRVLDAGRLSDHAPLLVRVLE